MAQQSPITKHAGDAAVRGYRFGEFQVDLRSGELQRRGIRVRLQEQPFQVLVALLAQPGEMVTREELRQRLWKGDTFVDFENSLNSAVNRLRDALGDRAENPVYIETLPRRGYRFLGEVAPMRHDLGASAAVAPAAQAVFVPHPEATPATRPAPRHQIFTRTLVVMAGLALLAATGLWLALKPTRTAMPPGKVLLAILPFENLTGDDARAYFVEGLTEELIAELGRQQPERLGVIARTSVLRYRGTKKTIREIGQELGVDLVLEGSVRLAQVAAGQPERVRVTAQLIEVRSQSHLWAQSYEHALTDFFKIQTDVAMKVGSSLAMELLPRVDHQPNAEAHTAFLKGKFYWNQRSHASGENALKALQFFERAVQLDGRYAAAYAALGAAHLTSATGGVRPIAEAAPQARAATTRALTLDPNLADAYLNLARITTYYDHDWAGAEKLFLKAQALDPNSPDVPFYYAVLLAGLNRLEEADQQIHRARSLDPLGSSPLLFGAIIANRRGDVQRALFMLQRHGELLGRPLSYFYGAGGILATRSRCAEALQFLQQADAIATGHEDYLTERVIIQARCGDRRDALRARDDVLRTSLPNYFRALVEAEVGNSASTYRYLESSIRDKDHSVMLLTTDPSFDPLRNEPRFRALVRRLALPQ